MSKELLTKLSEKRLINLASSEVEAAKVTLDAEIDEIAALESQEEKLTRLKQTYGFPQNSLLHLAAKFGDELCAAKILDILSAYPEDMIEIVNARNTKLFTPLHFAAHSGNPLVAEALIAGGADNNPQASAENRHWTPAHYAAQFGHAEVLEILIKSGVHKEYPTGFGLTPLVVGAEFGQLKVVELMLRLGANKNAQTAEDNHKMTALHYAAVGNFCDVATVLLKAGIKRNQLTNSGLSALDLAIQSDHVEMVVLLLSWGVGDLDHALEFAKAHQSLHSAEEIKIYLKIKKDFFNTDWLRKSESGLIETLKKFKTDNLHLGNISPIPTSPLNAYGILALKRKTGIFSKKEETLSQFASHLGLNRIANSLGELARLVK